MSTASKWASVRWCANKKPLLWNVELYDHHSDRFKVVAFALTEEAAWARMHGGKSRDLMMVGWVGSGHGNL